MVYSFYNQAARLTSKREAYDAPNIEACKNNRYKAHCEDKKPY